MNLHDIEVTTIKAQATTLGAWRGKTLLIVNVASRCGLTSQYAGLQALHERFADRGLVVMGFPCNQFGGQEPGTEAEIAQFCSTRYQVDFPMFAKVEVNGPGTHPLYQLLKSKQPAKDGSQDISWNFAKFLVNANGEVIRRYDPQTSPDAIGQELEAMLGTKSA
jgi:glutathione peroxidase